MFEGSINRKGIMMVSAKSGYQPGKPLTPTMEDYLEAIFDLEKSKKAVRVKDIAGRMDVKMPTVTSMLKTLSGKGLVNYEKYEYVELTVNGTKVGKEISRRHQVLFKFLTDILKIKAPIADEEACKMEHALSAGTLSSITDFMEFIQACPRAGDSWLSQFEEFRLHGQRPEDCAERTLIFSSAFKKKVNCLKD
jgi:DtxR family Mn-dependent transcriptional regulator